MSRLFTNIRPDELPLLAKSCKGGYPNSKGEVLPLRSVDQIYNDLETINDILSIQRVKTLMIRKRGFQKALDGIITHAIEKEKGGSDA